MPIKHAKLSASGSSRWMNCAGSIKAEQDYKNSIKFKPQDNNSAALYGTAAHELSDIILSTKGNINDYLGQTLTDAPTVEVDQEMIDNVTKYVDYVQEVGGKQYYEIRLDFSHLVPEGFGTADAIAIKGDTLHVIDLKMGRIPVSAFENSQATLYALGAVEKLLHNGRNIKNIVCHIFQPRIEGGVSTWELSLPELLARGQRIKLLAAEALSDNAKRTAGATQCKWCAAAPTCSTLNSQANNIIAADFDDLDDLPTTETLTPDQLTKIVRNKKMILAWVKAAEDHIYNTLLIDDGNDAEYKSLKLVAGRGARKWSDVSQVEKKLTALLGEDAFEKKLLSVPKALKALEPEQAAELEAFITKADGKPTLVGSADKRPAIGTLTNDFEKLVDS